jgi:hopanoid biosynthesis associated protein HpnK
MDAGRQTLAPGQRPAGRPAATARRLIVNADDFGRSRSINQAVLRAHREGILTSASLMVNEACAAEAVEMARANPKLGVGLHLALVCGHSALPWAAIPGLVNHQNQFSNNAVCAGWRYFSERKLRPQLREEIKAQFEKFHATGLPLDHVNGHLNLHLHPRIFGLLMENARAWKIAALRLTRDRFGLNARLAAGKWAYRASHAVIFALLCSRARPTLDSQAIRYTRAVFGLLQNGRVDESYVRALLPKLPRGDSELYSHPSLDLFRKEFDVLISPAIKTLIQELDIRLIRYQDL